MKNKYSSIAPEAGVAIIIVALLALIHSPIGMPMMAHLSVLGLLLVCFIAYAAFIMREEAGDERAVMHRMVAARASFFTGTTILTLGVFLDALKGEVNDWLIGTLVAMIIAKLVARLYADKNL